MMKTLFSQLPPCHRLGSGTGSRDQARREGVEFLPVLRAREMAR